MTLANINKLFCTYRRKPMPFYRVANINRGDCYRWACIVHKVFGAELCSIEIVKQKSLNGIKARGFTVSRHAIVSMDGKYYDAQCLRGVVNWRSLPILKHMHDATFEKMSAEQFQESWHFKEEQIELEMKDMGVAA